jgi:hypothetical protein
LFMYFILGMAPSSCCDDGDREWPYKLSHIMLNRLSSLLGSLSTTN